MIDVYYRNGTTTHDFPVGPVLKYHTFGVRVINDDNDFHEREFYVKVRPSTDLPSQDLPVSKPEIYQAKVKFNSITVHNDHDGFWRGKGDFVNYAYVQGHRVIISTHVDSGDTVYFKPDKQVTVTLEQGIPLSIFTVGNEEDCNVKLEPILPPQYLTELAQIFMDPKLDWSKAISDAQSEIFNKYLTCDGDKLGTLKIIHHPPNYAMGTHSVKSSNGDFTLRYTLSMDRIK